MATSTIKQQNANRVNAIVYGTVDGTPSMQRKVDDNNIQRLQIDADTLRYWKCTNGTWTSKAILCKGDVLCETKTLSSKSADAGANVSWTLDVTKSGYTPILAVPSIFSASFVCYYCSISGNTLTFALHNLEGYSTITGDVSVNVLYV